MAQVAVPTAAKVDRRSVKVAVVTKDKLGWKPDLAWVFKKGAEPVGINLRKQRWLRLAEGLYSIVTFRLRGRLFESCGHAYLEVDPSAGEETSPLYLLEEPDSRWHDGKVVETGVLVKTSGIRNRTLELDGLARELIDASMRYVIDNTESNPMLVRKFGSEHNHYSDLGFSRFSQRRDSHHGVVTVGSAGLPELLSNHLGSSVWATCCTLASKMTGFDQKRFDAATPDQQDAALAELSCGALAACGFMFQWNAEQYDSYSLPKTVLGTTQDCEDNATAVVGAFNWLVANHDRLMLELEGMPRTLLHHLHTMGESMWMAAGYVNLSIANPESETDPDSISGHAFAVMKLRPEYRPDQQQRVYIVEGTNMFYVHPSTYHHDTDQVEVERLFGGCIAQRSAPDRDATYDAPTLQPLDRYRTVDVIFSGSQTLLVGKHIPDERFRVGLTIHEFVRWQFDTHPTADRETRRKIQETWDGFHLDPSFEQAAALFGSYPELSRMYKFDEDEYTEIESVPGVALNGLSARDYHEKRMGKKSGVPIHFPFATILLMPPPKFPVRR